MSENSDTRTAAVLEELRARFVRKFEGYRLQTEAEKAAGTYPDNFSAVPLGRGHEARMLYLPFPVPTPPGARLDRECFNRLLSALLYDYSVNPPYRPLVEYYLRNVTVAVDGVTVTSSEAWTVSTLLQDIREKERLPAFWAAGGNYRQGGTNEAARLLTAILDRLAPVLYAYAPCVPAELVVNGFCYEECLSTERVINGYYYDECVL